jgi:hypothetical protein
MNDHWNVLYQVSVLYADPKSKMATSAGNRLTEDHPMNIHVQFGFNHICISEKKAFEHFPIGSNVNLFPALVAILDFGSAYKTEIW